MGNPYRGEVELVVDGTVLPMRLTLGALAELETRLKSDSLVSLIERFEQGQFGTPDLIALLVAGLRGAGWTGNAEALMRAEINGGALHAARQAGKLLATAFSLPDDA